MTDTQRLCLVSARVLKGCLGIPISGGQVGLPEIVPELLCRENKLQVDKACFF